MTIEDKIKKYLLKQKSYFYDVETLAHDIAGIADKTYSNFACNIIDKLEKENAELKNTIKHLEGVSDLNSDLIKENSLLKAKLNANRFIFNTFERHKYQDKIEELEEQLREFEINEDEKFRITEIEVALKEVYSIVSTATVYKLKQILINNRKQFIENMEGI
jgi:hypothetical protein